jgi:hypothetical protein
MQQRSRLSDHNSPQRDAHAARFSQSLDPALVHVANDPEHAISLGRVILHT